ncbi:MAG: DNA double-strand break repair nuclease NurA, partial [Pyrinomonadaceae bacterium]
MLYRHHLRTALEKRRDDFISFERAWRDEVSLGARALRALGGRTSREVKGQVGGARGAGALPSPELEENGGVAVSFNESWRSHEEARRWALATLRERVTFAADGSQILPGREISLPVAGVQVAWFENDHTLDGGYRKEARFSIITPRELLEADGGAANAGAVVNLRRFQLEAEAVGEFIARKRGWQSNGGRVPVAFFDGMLLIAAGKVQSETQFPAGQISAAAKLVRLSREARVPVVGYIDQSYARDLVKLTGALDGTLRRARGVYDTQLLRAATDEAAPLLNAWGDRTVFFRCLREGLTEEFR